MPKPAIRTRHDRRADRVEPEAPFIAPVAPQSPLDGFAQLLWIQVEPDPLNPRKHFDEVAISELAASIARDGLLENLVVREASTDRTREFPVHRLVAGERRWRAIGELIKRGDWPKDRPIVCKVVDLDEAGHRRVALIENLQRKDLRPIDEASALKELMAVTGQGTAEIGKEIGFTQRFVQQRLQLLELPEKLQDQVNDGGLPIEKARTALAILPKLPAIKQVELLEGKITVDEAKAWLDERPKPLELAPATWLMAIEIYDAIERRPMKKASYEYDRTEVGYAAQDDRVLKELAMARLFDGVSKQQDKHYTATGRLYVSANYYLATRLEVQFGDAHRAKDARQELLASLRADAGVTGEFAPGRYSTPWLNGPFVVPQEIADQYAALLEERKRKEAKAKADAELLQRRAAERKAKAAGNAEVVQQLMVDLSARPPGACDVRFAQALADAGLPAPWRVEERASLVAADGREVLHASWYLDEQPEILAQRVLMAAAVNLAAGVVFTVEPDEQDKLMAEAALNSTEPQALARRPSIAPRQQPSRRSMACSSMRMSQSSRRTRSSRWKASSSAGF